jgi:hypothetical protein
MPPKRKSDALQDSHKIGRVRAPRKRSKTTASDPWKSFRGFRATYAPKRYRPAQATDDVKFKGYETEHPSEVYGMAGILPDVHYKVQPASLWQALRVYQKFTRTSTVKHALGLLPYDFRNRNEIVEDTVGNMVTAYQSNRGCILRNLDSNIHSLMRVHIYLEFTLSF